MSGDTNVIKIILTIMTYIRSGGTEEGGKGIGDKGFYL